MLPEFLEGHLKKLRTVLQAPNVSLRRQQEAAAFNLDALQELIMPKAPLTAAFEAVDVELETFFIARESGGKDMAELTLSLAASLDALELALYSAGPSEYAKQLGLAW